MSPDQLKEGIIRVIHENDNQEVTGDIMQSVLLDMVDTFTPSIEGFPPYIGEDGFWYVFDIDAGEYVSSGIPAQGPKGDPGSGAENAVQFTPQTLTPAQQAQAGENMGIPALLAKKQDKLIPGSGVTIAADGKTISAGAKIVQIDNFETFNPSSSLVDSETGATFTLKEGESCQFKAISGATGKPWMGSGTLGATNNSLSSIFYWSGTVTRIYSTYYMVTAYGASLTTGQPNMATRIYYENTRYDWIVGSDYSSRMTSGYTKLPSGVMIQWGVRSGSGSGSASVSFPISFAAVPFSCVIGGGSDPGAGTVIVGAVTSISASTFTMLNKWIHPTDIGYTANSFYFIAIGTWK